MTTSATPPPADPTYISPDPLTPEERERFQTLYAALLRERFAARLPTTAQRLTLTQELIQAWRRGWTGVGDTYKQLPAGTRPTAASTARARGPGATRAPTSIGPLLGIALAVLAVVAWYVWGPALMRNAERGTRPVPVTPVDSAFRTPTSALEAPTVGSGGISIGTQSTPTVLTPLTLRLAGRSFVVTPSGLNKDKNWVVSPDPLYANWLAGSLVNLTFFLALEADPGVVPFITALHAPQVDPVQVTIGSTSGVITTRIFQLDTVRPIGRTDTDVYNSTALGLTVVVRYDLTDTRLYLHGREVLPDQEPPLLPPSASPRWPVAPTGTPAPNGVGPD